MNINELFEKLIERFGEDEIKGEFTLNGNCIIWEYNLDNNSEEIQTPISDDDEDEITFDFDAVSPEELLQEAYNEVLALLELFFDELEETDNWTFSDSDVVDNTISFKIF